MGWCVDIEQGAIVVVWFPNAQRSYETTNVVSKDMSKCQMPYSVS